MIDINNLFLVKLQLRKWKTTSHEYLDKKVFFSYMLNFFENALLFYILYFLIRNKIKYILNKKLIES